MTRVHWSPVQRIYQLRNIKLITAAVLLGLLFLQGLHLHGPPAAQAQTGISFTSSRLSGTIGLDNPTSMQFGPDGRLYVSQQDGLIRVYTVLRNSATNYIVTNTETINLIQNIPNHNDDGAPNANVTTRQVTGILVTGTAANPVIYVTSSDPRIAVGSDSGLDTNSGILSRLTWNGSSWDLLHLVRGLPRSEENHASNGMALDAANNILYVTQGGHTNMGAPSNLLGFTPEYALSAAILSVDLDAIGSATYDLPTLDDPSRPNVGAGVDENDPFGGNDGANQARIVPGGPVQVYSPGYRNPYDVLITQAGRMYTVDNGANGTWGGPPINCTHQVNENDSFTYQDGLHFIPGPGYYGGHPAPVRGNPQGIFPSEAESPVPFSMANPAECTFLIPGVQDDALTLFGASTNGLAEYAATNFGGAMQGNLLTASFNGAIYRIQLNAAGDDIVPISGADYQALFNGFGETPLDVIAQSDTDIFAGTVWVALYGSDAIQVFEPVDFDCTGVYSAALDEDGDGYDNADEIDAGSDPCSAGSRPGDNDGDLTSDVNDPDDDDDGIPDVNDPFAIDAANGLATALPLYYDLFNNDPGTGFFGVGFTGLMINGVDDYLDLFDPIQLTVGGTAGKATIDTVTTGDALGAFDNQDYGFQFGVNVGQSTGNFVVRGRIESPYFLDTDPGPPQNNQALGVQIGTGDQNNYVKIALAANGGAGGIEVVQETNGVANSAMYPVSGILNAVHIDFFFAVDPVLGTVQPQYAGDDGPVNNLGGPLNVSGAFLTDVLQGPQAMAVGIIATSRNAIPFAATWDAFEVRAVQPSALAALPASVNFGVVSTGNTAARTITLSNQGGAGDPSITVSSLNLTGDDAFSVISNPVPVTLAPGAAADVQVSFAPADTGQATGTLQITHSGQNSPLNIPLSGQTVADPIYRVNAGGPLVTASPINWSEDTQQNPSPYVNAQIIGNQTFTEGPFLGTNTTDAPNAIFAHERWDPSWGDEMQWNFPVQPGDYEVRLYFAEIFPGTSQPGDRVFDVAIEGNIVMDDYDTVADVGYDAAVMKSFSVSVADSTLTITFIHVVENPAIKGIEIVPITLVPSSTLGAAPSSVNYGTVEIGAAPTTTVTLTNQGGSGDPSISISSISITGADAGEFSFTSSGPDPLGPGASRTVNVTFAPFSVGAKTASLVIIHNGDNSPLSVPLSGSGASLTLGASPDPVALGSAAVGSSTTESLTLTHEGATGYADIQITDVTLTGVNAAEFSHNFTGPVTLAAGASTTIDVTFTAASAGLKSAVLQIAHSGTNSPLAVTLTATGTSASATAQAFFVITPVGDINASTFGDDSFRITNNSTGGQNITRVRLDLSAAMLPDAVFDPLGLAGDPAGKCITADLGAAATGYVTPADPCTTPYSGLHDDGYDVVEVTFTNFNPGEEFRFSADIDPTSIRGAPQPGPNDSGSVSGLELTGAEVTVEFDDGSILTAEMFRIPSSVSGSQNSVRAADPPQPTLSVLGVPTTPAIVPSANQTVRVSGPAGANVALLLVEAGLFEEPGGGYDIDLFEVNSVIAVAEYTGVIGGSGSVDIPVTLTDTDPSSGLNYMTAVVREADGRTGPTSDVVILQLDETASTSSLGASPSPVSFGSVSVGASSAQTVTLTSQGAAGAPSITITNVTITGADAAEFSHTLAGPGPLTPGASTTVDVTFAPTSAGGKAASLVITHTGSNSPLTVPLSGSASTPGVLSATPNPVNFGSVETGAMSAQAVTLTNQGAAGDPSVSITDIAITGVDAADFGYTFTNPGPLAPGASTTMDITFAPATTGLKSATLAITHTGSNSPLNVSLSGSSQQNAALGATPDPVSFGAVNVGSASTQAVTLAHLGVAGDLNIQITGITLIGADAAAFSHDFTSPVTLIPAATTTVNVTFMPATTGAKAANLVVAHSGTNSPLTVPLSGDGQAIATLGAAPTAVNYGAVSVGASATQTVTLTHTGASGAPAITLTGVTLTGADAAAFSHVLASAGPLAPGASTTVDITFTPTSDGAKTATLQVTHTGSNSPLSVPLSGSTGQITFTLINADTNADIGPLANGATLNLAALPTRNLNVRANVLTGPVGSVVFGLDANPTFRTESTPPYALAGDASGDYFPWTPTLGAHTVSATPYSGAGGTGTAGTPASVGFTVIDQATTATLGASPTSLAFGSVPVGSTAPLQTLTLTHLGTTGDPDIAITGVTLTGADAAHFSHSFSGAAPLAPGAATTFDVAFAPLTSGPKAATLVIAHSGTNSPLAVPLTGAGAALTLGATPASLSFGAVDVGASASLALTFTHQGATGDPDIQITGVTLTGADAAAFTHTFTTPITLIPGASSAIEVTFAPTAAGAHTASVQVTHTGTNSPLSIPLSGSGSSGAAGDPIFRVNAGGPLVTASPINWSEDTQQNPSPYVNAQIIGNQTFTDGAFLGTNTTDAPDAVFAHERWDPSWGDEMQWNFPVSAGDYEVRLYFAEIYSETNDPGERVFDVLIEGVVVLDDYDIAADVGFLTAVMKSFVVLVSDGNLTIAFGHIVENPALKAIEILPASGGAVGLSAAPQSRAFDAAAPGVPLDATATEDATAGVAAVEAAPLALPLAETMDDGAPRWATSTGWALTPAADYHGTGTGWQVAGASQESVLALSAPVDLRAAVNPVLTFHSTLDRAGATAAVEVSVDGRAWQPWIDTPSSANWTQITADLTALRGQTAWVRFVWRPQPSASGPAGFWMLDDVYVGEAPPPPAMDVPPPTEPPPPAEASPTPDAAGPTPDDAPDGAPDSAPDSAPTEAETPPVTETEEAATPTEPPTELPEPPVADGG